MPCVWKISLFVMEVISVTGKLKNTGFYIALLYFTQTLSVKGLTRMPDAEDAQQSSNY